MKRIFHVFCGLFVAVLMLTSCLNADDNSTTLYSDMAIKSFSLGNLNRYVHTTTSAGADSVYKQTFSASTYKMNIDQLNYKISNADSLPTGTDAAHVICSATTVNNGVIYVKSLISDTLFYFSSGSDSIDFTQPRIFRVYATDGRQVLQRQMKRDGACCIPLQKLPTGVYVVQVNTLTYKILKK